MRTGCQDFEVIVDRGEDACVLGNDGGQDGCLGGGGRHLLSHLVEAGVVAVPPHVPAPSAPRHNNIATFHP